MKDSSNATRELRFFLAGPERRVLRALAARVPPYLRPNHFTVLGTFGAVATGAAYSLTLLDASWLWVASLMIAVNWLGDSLDGTLARVRKHERPRYGYYLDHIVDAFSTIAIGVGLGLSPYVDFGVAVGLVLVYLVLSINVYLESTVFGVFKISYGRIGPTEVRLLLVLVNTALALAVRHPELLPSGIEFVANRVLVVLLVAMVALLVMRFVRNVSYLAKVEPQEFRRRSGHVGGAGGLPMALEVVSGAADVERAEAAAGELGGRGARQAALVAAHRGRREGQRVADDHTA